MEKENFLDTLLQMSMNLQDLTRISKIRFQETSLSVAQFRAVSIIAHFDPEGITIKQLSGILRLSPGATSKLVERIVRQGVIQRIPSDIDRRSCHVVLTPLARQITGDHSQVAENFFDRLLSDVPEQEREIFRLLSRKFNERLWRLMEQRTGNI
ncbi:MarR family winged helix-turn-helix transcriptional regulator [Victivallis vadensis]|uniref:Winged helix-turn-helix transcriptional regulator n=1 Tax=Victivallis vadensis TaxID=172901 RepID=A0A848AXP2_9BACT|nr:MarR family winged helix-turn-helix transcriptional regulator [Victivallis vadensis]NMD85476.1 winged helix-turn-helix transcriptional regulator [Victivallis vadensis]